MAWLTYLKQYALPTSSKQGYKNLKTAFLEKHVSPREEIDIYKNIIILNKKLNTKAHVLLSLYVWSRKY